MRDTKSMVQIINHTTNRPIEWLKLCPCKYPLIDKQRIRIIHASNLYPLLMRRSNGPKKFIRSQKLSPPSQRTPKKIKNKKSSDFPRTKILIIRSKLLIISSFVTPFVHLNHFLSFVFKVLMFFYDFT